MEEEEYTVTITELLAMLRGEGESAMPYLPVFIDEDLLMRAAADLVSRVHEKHPDAVDLDEMIEL